MTNRELANVIREAHEQTEKSRANITRALRKTREERGITVEKMAAKCKVSPGVIRTLERGVWMSDIAQREYEALVATRKPVKKSTSGR